MLIININLLITTTHHKNLILTGPGYRKRQEIDYPFNSIVPFSNFSFNFIKNTYYFPLSEVSNFFKDKLDPSNSP